MNHRCVSVNANDTISALPNEAPEWAATQLKVYAHKIRVTY